MNKFTINNDGLGRLCLELEYLLHAGVKTGDALTLLAEDEEDPGLKAALADMARHTDGGGSLAQAFAGAGCFPRHVCSMVDAGENSGRLEEALRSLAESCGRRAALDRRLRAALLYPSVLLLIMLAVVAVLLMYVLPIFNDVYAQLGSGLTGVAGWLLGFGRVLSAAAPGLLAVFGAAVLFLALFAASAGFRARVIDRWQERGGDRRLAGKLNRARFAQAMSLCYCSGMPLEGAISQAAQLLPQRSSLRCKSERCLELLSAGTGLARSMQEAELFTGAECRLLEAGVHGGAGERAMEQISLRLSEESDAAIDEAVSRIEPGMVVISSALIGVILLSVMLPLINIMSAIG